MRKVVKGDCDVALDPCVLCEGEGDFEGLANFMCEGVGGGTEDKRCFFGVGDAKGKKLGEAGLVAFDVPVSNMPG